MARRSHLPVLLGIALVAVAGCDSSGEGDGGALTTDPASTSTAAPTIDVTSTTSTSLTETTSTSTLSTPTPSTTTPSTTTPSTNAPSTTAPPPASAPSTTVESADTIPGAVVEGAIDSRASTIWGLHLFAGRPSDDVIVVVSDRLGPPTSDTGFVPMPAEWACTGKESYRVTRWGDLRMTFTQGDPNVEGESLVETEAMIAWSVGDDSAAPLAPTDAPPDAPAPSGATTTEGIGVGSTRDEVAAAYADDLLQDTAERIVVSPTITPGVAPTATLLVLEDGIVTGIGAGPPDCLDPNGDR